MKDEILQDLVSNGDLLSYEYENIEDVPGSYFRETERLILVFPSGKNLILDTFCSGSGQNTCLMIGAK